MMVEPKVSFVLMQDDRPLAKLVDLDPDRDWRDFVTTTSAWILQTYLRLKVAGSNVELRESLPASGIAVISAGDYREALRHRMQSTDALIAAPLGSYRRRPRFADVIIVQNPSEADGKRRLFVPHWPQPGLMSRDPSRGARIERAAFKGFPKNLDAAFQTPEWRQFLREQGIEWVHDAVPYAELQTDTRGLQFPDYRDIDLIVAVRPENPQMYPDRPATKLVNAWLAGVPAILGPELAYRALRQDPLDYLEVRNLSDAQAAVRQLVRDRGLYLAMIEHGKRRGTEFTVDRVRQQWQDLLFDRVPRLACNPAVRFWLGKPLWLRQLAGRWRWRRSLGGR